MNKIKIIAASLFLIAKIGAQNVIFKSKIIDENGNGISKVAVTVVGGDAKGKTEFKSGICGKVSGAGGGGFMMFFCDITNKHKLIRSLNKLEGTTFGCQFTFAGAVSWENKC